MHLKIFRWASAREATPNRPFSQVKVNFRNLDGMIFHLYSKRRSAEKISDYLRAGQDNFARSGGPGG